MRRASQNVDLVNDNGNLAISFGYDSCAEHEWGIDGIRRTFGVSSDPADLTVGRLAVTRADPDKLHLIEARNRNGEDRIYLLGGMLGLGKQMPAEFAVGYRENHEREGEPAACWDERAFMFSLPAAHKRANNLRSMHKAILACDALVYRSGGSIFGGSGLVIARRSTLPHEAVAKMEATFVDRKRLEEASEATGIRERVDAWGEERARQRGDRWGRPYCALSPRWARRDDRRRTKHPVVYWLNPAEQDQNNYGLFTVEELEQWMEGKGPIPMTAEQRRKRA